MSYDLMEEESSLIPRHKEKIVTALLALFAGSFGAHHFYLGNKKLGIFYLLFCWTFLPGFIAFIEGVLFLVMDDEEFDYKYNFRYEADREDQQRAKKSYASRRKIPKDMEENVGKISIADEIEKLHTLMVKGIISEHEFAERKDRLL